MQEDENDGISLREWKLQGLGSLDDPDDEVEEDAPLSLSASLGQLVGKSKFSDVVFLVGPDSREVPAHRMFLATRSPVFEAMLYPSDGDAAEMKAGVSGGARMEIKVPDCSPHAFVTMLRCIYSGNAGEIDAESLVELLYVAKKCAPKRTTANCPAVVDLNAVNADSVDSLKAACNDFLSSGVNVQNACLLFNNEVAHTCRCKWVTRLLLRCSLQSLDQKDDVLKFIEEHFDIIINTEGFLNLTEKSLNAILDSNKLFVSEVKYEARVRQVADSRSAAREQIDLFFAVIEWVRAELQREGKADEDRYIKCVGARERFHHVSSLLARRAKMQTMLPRIRFPLMSMEEIASQVHSSLLKAEC